MRGAELGAVDAQFGPAPLAVGPIHRQQPHIVEHSVRPAASTCASNENPPEFPVRGFKENYGLIQLLHIYLAWMDFNGFYWILSGFIGFPGFIGFYWVFWVLLAFTGFYWVILGFTRFYWVLLGFTGLYWVSPGFPGFNRVIFWILMGVLGFTGLDFTTYANDIFVQNYEIVL